MKDYQINVLHTEKKLQKHLMMDLTNEHCEQGEQGEELIA